MRKRQQQKELQSPADELQFTDVSTGWSFDWSSGASSILKGTGSTFLMFVASTSSLEEPSEHQQTNMTKSRKNSNKNRRTYTKTYKKK